MALHYDRRPRLYAIVASILAGLLLLSALSVPVLAEDDADAEEEKTFHPFRLTEGNLFDLEGLEDELDPFTMLALYIQFQQLGELDTNLSEDSFYEVDSLDDVREHLEDNFVSAIKFEDGTVGMLSASWTFYGQGDNYLIFHCEKGSLHVNWDPNAPCVGHIEHPAGRIEFEPPPPIEKYPESWGVDVSGHFAAACLGREEPFCTGEEGMKSLQVILAAEKSASTGRSVKV